MALERLNAFIRGNGFHFDIQENQIDGEFHTVKTDTQKIWFKAQRVGGVLTAYLGDWKNPDKRLKFIDAETLASKELRAVNKFAKQVEKERLASQLQAKAQAEEKFFGWNEVSQQSDYLRAKKLSPSSGVKVRLSEEDSQKILVIPMFDETGEIWNIQQIFKSGAKRFHTKAKKKGVFHRIDGSSDLTLIGEGYATCLSAREVTGHEAYVSFDVSNLEPILKLILKKQRAENIILLADYDGENFLQNGLNTGMQKCKELALKYNVRVAIPCALDLVGVNLDFSDLWVDGKIEEIKRSVANAFSFERLKEFEFKSENPIVEPEKVVNDSETHLVPANVAVVDAPSEIPVDAKFRATKDYSFVVLPPEKKAVNYDSLSAKLLPDVILNKKGEVTKVLGTLKNFKVLLNSVGATLRYNVILKDQEWFIPDEKASVDNYKNVLYGRLLDLCERVGMPKANIDHYLTYLCDQNQFNPVAAWIESKPWDGVSRLEDFFKTVHVVDEENDSLKMKMKKTFITKWMLTAIASAYKPDGHAASGMLVFQGRQYIGKTKWFLSLTPPELQLAVDGRTVDTRDKDSVKQTVRYWLVELGELDATFKKSDIAALKAFITRGRDMFRAPYAKAECDFPRRTVFFGSVNDETFLADTTGNRRYWTLAVDTVIWDHGLDMQQIWAELLVQYRAGAECWLSREENEWLNDSNRQFEVIDPIAERLAAWGDWTSERGEWLSATQILSIVVGIDRPTNAEAQKCAVAVKKLNGDRKKREAKSGQRLLWVPIKSSNRN